MNLNLRVLITILILIFLRIHLQAEFSLTHHRVFEIVDNCAYFSMDVNGTLTYCKLNIDERVLHTYTSNDHLTRIQPSNDGKQIYFAPYPEHHFVSGYPSIYRMNSDGSNKERIFQNDSLLFYNYFINSDDSKIYLLGSRRIFFDRGGRIPIIHNSDYFEVDIKSKKVTRLTEYGLGGVGDCVYDEENQKIYFRIIGDKQYRIDIEESYGYPFNRKSFPSGFYEFSITDRSISRINMSYKGNLLDSWPFQLTPTFKEPGEKKTVLKKIWSGLYKFGLGICKDFKTLILGLDVYNEPFKLLFFEKNDADTLYCKIDMRRKDARLHFGMFMGISPKKLTDARKYIVSSNHAGLYKINFQKKTITDLTDKINGKNYSEKRNTIFNLQYIPNRNLLLGLMEGRDGCYFAILDPETKNIVKSFPWDSLKVVNTAL